MRWGISYTPLSSASSFTCSRIASSLPSKTDISFKEEDEREGESSEGREEKRGEGETEAEVPLM